MKILLVDDDDVLRSFLAKEVEARGCEVLQTDFGDGGLYLYQKNGPWEFELSDYRFISGPKIKEECSWSPRSTRSIRFSEWLS